MGIELKLNCGWITDANGEEIGETNFVVPYEYVADYYANNSILHLLYVDFEDFLGWYIPEEHGLDIYNKALTDNVLIVDKQVTIY